MNSQKISTNLIFSGPVSNSSTRKADEWAGIMTLVPALQKQVCIWLLKVYSVISVNCLLIAFCCREPIILGLHCSKDWTFFKRKECQLGFKPGSVPIYYQAGSSRKNIELRFQVYADFLLLVYIFFFNYFLFL